MKNRPAYKISGIIFAMTLLIAPAMADGQIENPFQSSVSTSGTVTVAFRGKPPYRNRYKQVAKLRAQQAAWRSTEELEAVEMSALELVEKEGSSTVQRKSTRKKYGHPYHR